jgi:putative addiction module killer protein
MIEIIRSDEFLKWFRQLRDQRARAKIDARILRLTFGNPGDVKQVGSGISEMRINHGPGYRVYYTQHGEVFAILLCGGDKSTQEKDITLAMDIAHRWRNSS